MVAWVKSKISELNLNSDRHVTSFIFFPPVRVGFELHQVSHFKVSESTHTGMTERDPIHRAMALVPRVHLGTNHNLMGRGGPRRDLWL